MAVVCKQCYWCAEQVGNINFWANIGLFIVKFLGGVLGRSQALIADALHSVSDIVVSLLLLVDLKITGAPPDEDHQWGHGNIEFIGRTDGQIKLLGYRVELGEIEKNLLTHQSIAEAIVLYVKINLEKKG